jgi:hypothetical protein
VTLQTGRWRKKPVVIDAVRFTGFDGGNGDELARWIHEQGVEVSVDPGGREMRINTLEGPIWARPGDWIIRGVDHELYPCKDHIFRATYEPADGQP